MGPENNFIDDLSQSGADIFQDPMSELSRKRQSYLLIVSMITVLLWATVIKPIEFTEVGLKFTFNEPKYVTGFMGLITIYFLIVYCLSIFQDVKIYQYKQLKPWFSLNNLAIQNANSLLDVLTKDFKYEEDELNRSYGVNIQAKFNEIRDRARTESIDEALRRADESIRNIKWRKSIIYKVAKRIGWNPPPKDELEIVYYEYVKKLNALSKRRDLAVKAFQKKQSMIIQIPKNFRLLSKFRFGIEFFFPVLLGLVATWTSFGNVKFVVDQLWIMLKAIW